MNLNTISLPWYARPTKEYIAKWAATDRRSLRCETSNFRVSSEHRKILLIAFVCAFSACACWERGSFEILWASYLGCFRELFRSDVVVGCWSRGQRIVIRAVINFFFGPSCCWFHLGSGSSFFLLCFSLGLRALNGEGKGLGLRGFVWLKEILLLFCEFKKNNVVFFFFPSIFLLLVKNFGEFLCA